jgi:hypothetical protein
MSRRLHANARDFMLARKESEPPSGVRIAAGRPDSCER